MKKIITATFMSLAMLASTGAAYSADPILGMWKRPANKGGTLENIKKCGSSFCVIVASGDYNGQQAGKFKANGDGTYSGSITDLAAEKTYKGKAKLVGNTLHMSGCVLAVLCKTEKWSRQ